MPASNEDPLLIYHNISSSDKEDVQPPPTKRKKTVSKWIKIKFSPVNTECRFIPDRGSTILEPLEYFMKYFMKYFPEKNFDDLAKR